MSALEKDCITIAQADLIEYGRRLRDKFAWASSHIYRLRVIKGDNTRWRLTTAFPQMFLLCSNAYGNSFPSAAVAAGMIGTTLAESPSL
jgi:hypothetical protein